MNAKVLAIGLLFGLKSMPEIHECAKDKTMHLLLDVRFSEDRCSVCRLLDKNLQQALNIGRKVALNLVSRYKQKNAPKSSLSHIMFKALMYISFIKKILQNWFPCKFFSVQNSFST